MSTSSTSAPLLRAMTPLTVCDIDRLSARSESSRTTVSDRGVARCDNDGRPASRVGDGAPADAGWPTGRPTGSSDDDAVAAQPRHGIDPLAGRVLHTEVQVRAGRVAAV